MTMIKKLNVENSQEFIDLVKDKELIVYEDIQGSQIFIKWTGDKFIIKPKSLRSQPLNFIDLATQKFYNQAYKYIHQLPDYVTDLLNKNWWFCFEYFPDNQPANIEYNIVPKGGLILTCIVKGSKYFYNYDELKEYGELFNVDYLPVLYKGKLSEKQLEIIDLYLNTSDKDLEYVFGEKNFAYFFYQILNPQLKNSFLMNDEVFNDNLEKIIFKIDNNTDYSFELLNPLYHRLSSNNNTEYIDTYSLILLSFLEYFQQIALKNYKLHSLTMDELYIEIVCKIFNDYIKDIKKDIEKWNFGIPSFFKEDKFKINLELIPNKLTKDFVKSNDKIEYVFKCILSSFSKKKKKPIGVFNQQTLILFNSLVKDINLYLEKQLELNREYAIQKSDVKNFKDYFDLKYEVDADGRLYPDVFDEFDDEGGEDKKKKKKKTVFGKKGGKKDWSWEDGEEGWEDFEIDKEKV